MVEEVFGELVFIKKNLKNNYKLKFEENEKFKNEHINSVSFINSNRI